MTLTDRQAEVLAFIRERAFAHEVPTIREIADEFDIVSPNGVMCHLNALVKKGRIKLLRDGKSRGIQLVGTRCDKCGGCGVLTKGR